MTEEGLEDAVFQFEFENPSEMASEKLERMLSGEEGLGTMDLEEVAEVLLRRRQEGWFGSASALLHGVSAAALLCVLASAFFGWKLYKSIKDKEKKKEEKKKMKQKKKK